MYLYINIFCLFDSVEAAEPEEVLVLVGVQQETLELREWH